MVAGDASTGEPGRRPPATPELPLARFRLEFVASGNVRLPAYAGSTWRGGFGHALRRAVCVTRLPRCPECLLFESPMVMVFGNFMTGDFEWDTNHNM